jgi:ABC-type sugar transport system permease subunit
VTTLTTADQAARPAPTDTTSRTGSRRRRRLLDVLVGLAFLAPKFVFFGLFVAVPFVYTFILVFQRGDVLMGFHWVGLDNISAVVSDTLFRQTLVNTFFFMIIYLPLSLIMPLGVGRLFASTLTGVRIYRALIYMPSLLSVVAVGLIWRLMLDPDSGPINIAFQALGGDAFNPFENGTRAMIVIALITVWGGLGFGGIIYMAGLNDIPNELFESARIDGAGAWRIFWHIQLPLLRPLIQFLAVINTIGAVQVFDIIFVLTKGGPGTSTSTAMWYIYTIAFNGGSVGYAAAMSVVLLAITATLSVIYFRLTRSGDR